MTNIMQKPTKPAVARPGGSEMIRYGAILADPPWKFDTWGPGGLDKAPEKHYTTESVSSLSEIPVRDWAADDCALFMWIIDSHLEQALSLMNAWDFKYKTIAFIWRKTGGIGLGYWSRKQAEVCLLGTRGKPKRLSGGVRQVIEAPRREHSRKPDEIYSRVEELVAGPYLEMFARQPWDGWDSWGNEVDKFAGDAK